MLLHSVVTPRGFGRLLNAGSMPAGLDSGQLAKWVSNASFATLTLIYSFTQMLDLASQFSTLAGVTMRVGQLLHVSSRCPSMLPFLVLWTGTCLGHSCLQTAECWGSAVLPDPTACSD